MFVFKSFSLSEDPLAIVRMLLTTFGCESQPQRTGGFALALKNCAVLWNL